MHPKRFHRWFYYLCALEAAAVIAALLRIPSEGGTLSPIRIALLTVPLLFMGAWIYLGLRAPHALDRFAKPWVILSLALLSVTYGLTLFFLRYLDPQRFLSIYERLSPVLWYFLLLSFQGFLYLLYVRNGIHIAELVSQKSLYTYAALAFLILIGVFLFVVVTRLGVTVDPAYWGEPGPPLLGWQFALALLGGILVLCIGLYTSSNKLDILLPVLIYLFMVAVCLSVPLSVLRNSFYMPFARPIQQPFPYSDSMYYDRMAQSVLIGHPYQGVIPTRPLYIFFLTVLHLLFGQDYSRIIIGQTFALAFIPVILYFLGKKLHSREAGVTVALFFIFRELTSLLISSETRVTNTKMILVDLPTLFLLLVACLFAFRWFERRDGLSAFLAGGTFGLLLLLRTQSLLILPLIVLAALLHFGWRNKSTYVLSSFFVLGLVITVIPWLTHNYLLTGKVAFDADFQYKLLASQYAYTGNLDIEAVSFEGKGLAQILLEFAIKDPAFVFGFIGNHFLATQINGLLALPLIEPYNGISAPLNLYWMSWDGHLAWYNAALLILYLAVISFGVAAAWKRWRWLGLLPLAFSLGYGIATALSRYSSWRYDFPSDWISYFYFGVGFAELLQQAALLFGAQYEKLFPSHVESIATKTSSPARGVMFASIFVLISAAPWMIKNISSPRYADQSTDTLMHKITSLKDAPTAGELDTFVMQAEAFLEVGRLLYPRYYGRNAGLSSGNPLPAYAARDFSRVGFVLLNQGLSQAVFPVQEYPGDFPHGADAIVLGCQKDDYVDVRLIAFPALDLVYTSAPLAEPCSP